MWIALVAVGWSELRGASQAGLLQEVVGGRGAPRSRRAIRGTAGVRVGRAPSRHRRVGKVGRVALVKEEPGEGAMGGVSEGVPKAADRCVDRGW